MKANLETQNMTLKHELASRLAIHQLFRITIRDNIRKHSETSSKRESSWGGIFPKRKHVILTPYWVPVSHISFYFITATMGVEQSIHVRQGGVNSLFERALLDALREAAEESQVPSEQFEHAWDPEDCSPKFRVLRDRLTARRLPSPLTTDAIRGMFTIQEIPLPQKQFRTKRCATILFYAKPDPRWENSSSLFNLRIFFFRACLKTFWKR